MLGGMGKSLDGKREGIGEIDGSIEGLIRVAGRRVVLFAGRGMFYKRGREGDRCDLGGCMVGGNSNKIPLISPFSLDICAANARECSAIFLHIKPYPYEKIEKTQEGGRKKEQ